MRENDDKRHARASDNNPDLSLLRNQKSKGSISNQKSKGSMYASSKKDACFYSQGTLSADGDDMDGQREEQAGSRAHSGRRQRLQVWFREPNMCRTKDRGTMFVPQEYTEYEFAIQWGERRWVVRRRYREFYALDKSLDEALPESVKLPDFPGKSAFGRMSPSLVRTRRMALEQYLRTILLDVDISALKQVRAFCKMPVGCNEDDPQVPWENFKVNQPQDDCAQQG